MWPAEAFSVARESIHEKSSNLKLFERCVRLHLFGICLIRFLALDKVYLHKLAIAKTFSVYYYCFCFIHFTINL